MASVKYGHLTLGFLCERSRGFEVFEEINLVMKLDFYVLKVYPTISRITANGIMPDTEEHCIIYFGFMLLIQMNGALKMVSSVGSL